MKAVVIGTGRIGCGFAGQLLHASGHEVCFISRQPEMANYLQQTGSYRVRLVNGQSAQEQVVHQTQAIALTETHQVTHALATADLIITSVGSNNLPVIAPYLAQGLRQRSNPVNILAFENLNDAGAHLNTLITDHLPAKATHPKFGVAGVLVSRAVSQKLGGPNTQEPLTFIGDPLDTWIVDGSSLVIALPNIQGMLVTDQFNAWIQRKLYTYSAGHAITAYLGYLKGYHYIHTAIRDPEIRAAVLAAMTEGQRGLAARHGENLAGNASDLLGILNRFENALLNDPITRVGRDPQRKLGSEDRLIGAARLAEKAGINPENLALGAAAALFFDSPNDPSAAELQHWIKTHGTKSVLHQICGLNPNRGLGRFIADAWAELAAGWQRGNQLLSLQSMAWAWS